ncbi:hypothetical protein TYRP_004037 [Tyrophagus putrescentiae]|nr:hypothetical protein TYRP_004037 [Tyrophagus putrescentiae]
MSYQTQYSNTTMNFDLDNEDEFEEFEQDNWSTQQGDGELWDENWDEMNMVDDDLANYLNMKT